MDVVEVGEVWLLTRFEEGSDIDSSFDIYIFFFQTGFLRVALVELELDLWSRLALVTWLTDRELESASPLPPTLSSSYTPPGAEGSKLFLHLPYGDTLLP